MIREYERALTEKDKQKIAKEVHEIRAYFPQRRKAIQHKTIVLIGCAILIYLSSTLWLSIPLSIVSFLTMWLLVLDIKDHIRLPKFLLAKEAVIEAGIAVVREINIDRYIKIESYHDEGDHFIIEFEGQLSMIGGQEFDGIRKLKNRIEYIDILDADKKRYYHTRIDKYGNSLSPYYVVKGNKLSDEFVNSELWGKLTDQHSFEGKLEDLIPFLNKNEGK